MMPKRICSLAVCAALLFGASPASAETAPGNLLYEGRILDSARNPVTTAIVLRFSLWQTEDWVSGDTSSGSINTGSATYGGWFEAQTVTPNSNGIVSVRVGSDTALPAMNAAQHTYFQVEVKASGQPDTSYELLDPTGDAGADTVDRRLIGSVAYAKNAESIGRRTAGTSSGSLLLLGSGGQVGIAQMASGTNAMAFTVNAANAEGDAVLTFGNALLPEMLRFSTAAQRFEFSDDVYVAGALDVAGTMSGQALQVNGAMTGSSLYVAQNFSGAGLADCTATGSKLLWDAATQRFSCGTDQNANSLPDTATFLDTTTESLTTSDVDLWDGPYPNITVDAATNTVLVNVMIRLDADGGDTETDAFFITRETDGTDPTCTDTQVGEMFHASMTTNSNQFTTAHATFVDSPGVAGEVRYTVCSDAETTIGTDSNDTLSVRFNFIELGL